MSFSIYQQFEGLAIALPAGTETVAVTSPPIQSVADLADSPGRVIRGTINVTGGATGGAWSVKCRYQNATGTQIGGTRTVTMAAATTQEIPFNFMDNGIGPSPVAGEIAAGGVYVITLTAAGSAGTVNEGGIEVFDPIQNAAS